jgi:DNA-binding NtrC family response regulator
VVKNGSIKKILILSVNLTNTNGYLHKYIYFGNSTKSITLRNLSYSAVCIVDDELDWVKLFTELIHNNGYQVKGFTDPLFSLDYIQKHPEEFGLIILDYKMPLMQGCELSSKISEINPKIQMIILTAFSQIVNNKINLEILKKPITLNRLLEIVHKYMNYAIV